MENQKLENLLNLALAADEQEREKSPQLGAGYDPVEKTWELIIKYSGNLDFLKDYGILVEELLNEYAIITVPESLIEALSRLPQIEFVEKPKPLYFAINQAKAAACITSAQTDLKLSGRGVLLAVIDSGIDYFHRDFRLENGETRIAELWDQGQERIYSRKEINEALSQNSRAAALALVPSVDISGHGTAVAGIAAGNGKEGKGQYRGVAYESELLVIKLGTPKREGFPRTTELMRAMNYAVKKAVSLNQPLSVNLSFGNTYGSHDGTSLLERFIDDISNYGKTVFVTGSGNEGAAGGHTSGQLQAGELKDIELSVAEFETGFSVQLWKSYADRFDISLVTPWGETVGPLNDRLGASTLVLSETKVLIYYGEPSPYSQAQEIYLDFQGISTFVDSGIWRFRLNPKKIVRGNYDFWLPSAAVLNRATRFLQATPDTTLTIPSTASMAITVGAYDDAYQSYADFSGRGYTRENIQIKPDLAAPGVGIIAAKSGGGYEAVTGTSFASPFVAGSAALLMQWGIVEGRDPFLYGEKVKAYLIFGARQLPGFVTWPNPLLGYGVLCLKDSIPT